MKLHLNPSTTFAGLMLMMVALFSAAGLATLAPPGTPAAADGTGNTPAEPPAAGGEAIDNVPFGA